MWKQSGLLPISLNAGVMIPRLKKFTQTMLLLFRSTLEG